MYEIINPADFGMGLYVHSTPQLPGWIESRASQLNPEMTDVQYKACMAKIKAMADVRPLAVDNTDGIIRSFHRNLKHGQGKPLLAHLVEEKIERGGTV